MKQTELVCFMSSVVLIWLKMEKMKISVRGAETFLGMKDLSWQQEEEEWNTRSLLTKGQEFKGFIEGLIVICVVETWLKPTPGLVLKDYLCLRRDGVG